MGPSTLRFPLPLLLGILVAFSPLASAVRANDADAEQTAEQRSFHQNISEKLFNGLKKLANKIATKLTSLEHCDLTILSISRDDRNRMYIDLEGECDLHFPVMPGKLKRWMDDLPGHHMKSDGPMNVDYTVTCAEQTGEKSFHVEYRVKLIIVMEELLRKMVKFGTSVVGTLTLMSVGNDLVTMIDGIDGIAVGERLGQGLKDMTQVCMGLAGVEAYDAWRGFRTDRQNMQVGNSSVSSVLLHLAGSLVKGAIGVGTQIVGMSVGAAIGTALFPGVGSTIGALAGAAGLTIVGNIAYTKLTVDLPIAYRLGRIRRMVDRIQTGGESEEFNQYLAGKIEKQEIKLVKRFSLELRTDKFRFFDELCAAFKAMPAERRACYASLRKKIEEKLRFEVVNRGDKLMAWKLDQMRMAFGEEPLTAGK